MCRDDIPVLLIGIQEIWADEDAREELFRLLDEHILHLEDRLMDC